jgi:hypothetical protein
MAVLSGWPHRFAFDIYNSAYKLEYLDDQDFRMPKNVGAPLSQDEQEELYQARLKKYQELVGQFRSQISDADTQIPTPVIVAMQSGRLQKKGWIAVDSIEWGARKLSSELQVKDFQTEHMLEKVDIERSGPESLAYLHFFPDGSTEKAVLHVYYRLRDHEINPEKEPYSVVIDPVGSIADVRSGLEEIDVLEGKKAL